VDLSQDGLDPVELARGLDASPSSRAHLVDLTTALAQGHEEAGTIMAGLENVGLGIDDRVWERSVSMLETVSDLLLRDLQSTETDDLGSIRDEFPAFEGRDPFLSFQTLGDYLRLEEDEEVLGQVVDVWAGDIGEALRQRNVDWLATLTFPLRPDGGLPRDPARTAMYEGAVRKVLTPALLSELTTSRSSGGQAPDAPAAAALLAGLGPVVVDALFDVLAEERGRAERAQLLGLLRILAATSLDRVATRLSDPRWYVVRNAVHVLSRIGGPGVTDLLARAAQYPTPAVRREALRGLASIGGDDMLPQLERIALTDSDDDVRMAAVAALGGLTRPSTLSPLAGIVRKSTHRHVQTLALEQISRHPAQEAVETLESLASRRSRPRVGRALRRVAKAAVQIRRGAGP